MAAALLAARDAFEELVSIYAEMPGWDRQDAVSNARRAMRLCVRVLDRPTAQLACKLAANGGAA